MHQWDIFTEDYIFSQNVQVTLIYNCTQSPVTVLYQFVQLRCSSSACSVFHDSLLKCSSNLLTLHHLHTVNQLAMSHNYFHAFLQCRHDNNSLHYVMLLGCSKRTSQQALPLTQSASTQSKEAIICSTHHHANHQQLSHTTFTMHMVHSVLVSANEMCTISSFSLNLNSSPDMLASQIAALMYVTCTEWPQQRHCKCATKCS